MMELLAEMRPTPYYTAVMEYLCALWRMVEEETN